MPALDGLPAALKKLRGERSQSAVARDAGLTAQQVNRYEKGKALPELRILGKLLDGLGTNLHGLARALDEVNGRDATPDDGSEVAEPREPFYNSPPEALQRLPVAAFREIANWAEIVTRGAAPRAADQPPDERSREELLSEARDKALGAAKGKTLASDEE